MNLILNNLAEKYLELLHAMQTGVAYEMEVNSEPTEPKHLRVGINAAMSDHTALVTLLIEKGIFTEEEYLEAIIKQMGKEVKRYEDYLSKTLYGNVKLG